MVRPLKYNSGLSLEEAKERYREVREEFKKVKGHYGFFSKIIPRMRKGDKKTLSDCIGVLLPLGLESSVQEQISKAKSVEETLHNKISQLSFRIMDYLANFKNTGTKRLY